MAETETAARHDRSELDGTPASTAPFPVSPDSPFADGYDIASERDALADLVAAENPDQADPRWARFIELRERESELRRITKAEARRPVPAATPEVRTANRVAKLGQLADATPDTMTLHTKDAYRMFTGRSADAETKVPPIPGAKRFAAVLKSIWHLSANDNPYEVHLRLGQFDRLEACSLKPLQDGQDILCQIEVVQAAVIAHACRLDSDPDV